MNKEKINKAIMDINDFMETTDIIFYGNIWDIIQESGITNRKDAKEVFDKTEITNNKLRGYIYEMIKQDF